MKLQTVRAQESGLDGVVFLDVPTDECLRRFGNRKIDPSNGNIYHMEDNPPPEDPKVRERLQDYQEPEGGTTELKIKESSDRYEHSEKELKKWTELFG